MLKLGVSICELNGRQIFAGRMNYPDIFYSCLHVHVNVTSSILLVAIAIFKKNGFLAVITFCTH